MNIFGYLLGDADPFRDRKPVKIVVRQLGIKQVVRVHTKANGDIKK